MFSKTVFACLMAVCLVQPNEAIYGLDSFLEGVAANLATQANTAAQSGFTQATSLLVNLQTNLQSAAIAVAPQISTAINNAIISAVTQAGGSQAKVTTCISQFQPALTAFQTNALNSVISACLNVNISAAISLISSVSGLANNLTTMVVNLNKTVAAACPPPASGDLVGNIANAVCTVSTIGMTTGGLTFQSMGISGYANQATALVSSIQSTIANGQTCVQSQLQKVATNATTVIAPIVQCSLLP